MFRHAQAGDKAAPIRWRSHLAIMGVICLGCVPLLAACASNTSIQLNGTISYFTPPDASYQLQQLLVGSGGQVWFVEANTATGTNISSKVGTVKDDGTMTVVKTFAALANTSGAFAVDPQGNLWYFSVDTNGRYQNVIERLAPNGAVQDVNLSGMLFSRSQSAKNTSLIYGPGGQFWAVVSQGQSSVLASITPAGMVQEYPLPDTQSTITGLTIGSDRNLWFEESIGTTGTPTVKLVRMTPSGAVTSFQPSVAQLSNVSINSTELVPSTDASLWWITYNNLASSSAIEHFSAKECSRPILCHLNSR